MCYLCIAKELLLKLLLSCLAVIIFLSPTTEESNLSYITCRNTRHAVGADWHLTYGASILMPIAVFADDDLTKTFRR